MQLQTFFTDFDGRITPTTDQRTAAQEGHRTLRERLESDPELGSVVEITFLQGSYRRSTAVRPKASDNLDVDVIVVTNIDSASTSPAAAIERFIPFVEKYYSGKYRRQGRSIGISLSDVDLDLVVTAKPDNATAEVFRKSAALGYGDAQSSEWSADILEILGSAEWRQGSLLIPDREAGKWEPTHPLAQIEQTVIRNKQCNGQFLPVVRAAKWRNRWSRDGRSPKSFPLERIVGEYCPDGISSVADGVVLFYENALSELRPYAQRGEVPFLPDYGAPEHNVLGRCSAMDIQDFVADLSKAAPLARAAYDETERARSADLWRQVLGEEFPRTSGDGDKTKGFTERAAVTVPATARFAVE